jgi:hypothetical protein
LPKIGLHLIVSGAAGKMPQQVYSRLRFRHFGSIAR